ncbi:MAG TPA: helix-turn-helix domain-containing protein [Pirellulales bacterium]|nr:helix-turn-helix domain-containing protein [Pirellulales bacterium]
MSKVENALGRLLLPPTAAAPPTHEAGRPLLLRGFLENVFRAAQLIPPGASGPEPPFWTLRLLIALQQSSKNLDMARRREVWHGPDDPELLYHVGRAREAVESARLGAKWVEPASGFDMVAQSFIGLLVDAARRAESATSIAFDWLNQKVWSTATYGEASDANRWMLSPYPRNRQNAGEVLSLNADGKLIGGHRVVDAYCRGEMQAFLSDECWLDPPPDAFLDEYRPIAELARLHFREVESGLRPMLANADLDLRRVWQGVLNEFRLCDVDNADAPATAAASLPPDEAWPPNAGWHFRPGQYAYNGESFDLTGAEWRLLKLFGGNPSRRFAIDDLWKAAAGDNNPVADRNSTRTQLSNLRNALRRNHGLTQDVDPIPHSGKGIGTVWRLDLHHLRKSKPKPKPSRKPKKKLRNQR